MAITPVPAVVTGQTYLAADYNTYVKDNINTLNVGTAAGDLVYWSAVNSPARLAAPSTSTAQILTNSSAGTPAYAPIGWRAIVYRSTDQTGFSSSSTQVTWTTVAGNYISWWDGPTRMTVGVTGVYLVSGSAEVSGYSSLSFITGNITRDGATVIEARAATADLYVSILSFPARAMTITAGQYLEMFIENSSGTVYGDASPSKTWLQAVRIQ